MRIPHIVLLMLTLVTQPVHADDALAGLPPNVAKASSAFPELQTHCVQTGSIRFGAKGRWKNCEVTRGRWFVTLDFLDQYQTQYCLGKRDKPCEQRALLVFSNRAYTPTARLLLQRVDAGNTEYDDPLVVRSAYGTVMLLTSRTPGSADTQRYYLWQADHWSALEAEAWQRELVQQLPPDSRIKSVSPLDISRMSARVVLEPDAAARERVLDVPLKLSVKGFTLVDPVVW
ncbi:MAG: hypothetical protein ABL892_06225 [Thiobacillaceae bacterium]